jgi:hypothetical protein
MSRNGLIVAVAALALAAVSPGGALAAEFRPDSALLAHEAGSAPASIARDLRLDRDLLPRDLGLRGAESAESHIVEAGVWSSLKNSMKYLPRTLATGAKAIGGKIKDAVTRPGKTAAGIWNGVKSTAKSVGRAMKTLPGTLATGAKAMKPGSVWSGIKSTAKSVGRAMKTLPGTLATGAKAIGGKVKSAAKSVVGAIKKRV